MHFKHIWSSIKEDIKMAVTCKEEYKTLYVLYNTEKHNVHVLWYTRSPIESGVLHNLFISNVLKKDDYVIYDSYIDDNICSFESFVYNTMFKYYNITSRSALIYGLSDNEINEICDKFKLNKNELNFDNISDLSEYIVNNGSREEYEKLCEHNMQVIYNQIKQAIDNLAKL
jgi:uncharacterized membrane protein